MHKQAVGNCSTSYQFYNNRRKYRPTCYTSVGGSYIRYFDLAKENVVDALFDSVIVEDGTALGLYNVVKLLLNDKNIPIESIIGFGSDNYSSMMGSKGGS